MNIFRSFEKPATFKRTTMGMLSAFILVPNFQTKLHHYFMYASFKHVKAQVAGTGVNDWLHSANIAVGERPNKQILYCELSHPAQPDAEWFESTIHNDLLQFQNHKDIPWYFFPFNL